MELVFVYNAKSDAVSATVDYAKKLVTPSGYDCNLCKLTHHILGEKKVWKHFRKSVGVPMTFLHSDEFEKQYGKDVSYPVVLIKENGKLNTLLSKEKVDNITEVEQLIESITNELESRS